MDERTFNPAQSLESEHQPDPDRFRHYKLRQEYIMTHYFADHPNSALTEDILSQRTPIERAYRILKETGGQDPVTHVLRADLFPYALSAEISLALAKRESQTSEPGEARITLAVFDIDDFKLINEEIGHDQANDVLERVAQIISQEVRINDQAGEKPELTTAAPSPQPHQSSVPIDTVIRWGGEEFVAIFSSTSLNPARVPVERIRQRIEAELHDIRPNQRSITISCGLTEYLPDEQPKSDADRELLIKNIFQSADRQMYAAKKSGKNAVYPPPETTKQV